MRYRECRTRVAIHSGVEAKRARDEAPRIEKNRTQLRCLAPCECKERRVGEVVEVGTIRQRVSPRYRTENHGQIKHGDSVAVYGESKRFLAPWRRVTVRERDFLRAGRARAIVN